MARACVVFHSQTTGVLSKVVECFGSKTKAAEEARKRNRTAGMDGWYSAHLASVIRGWRERGDRGDWSLAGDARRRRRRRR